MGPARHPRAAALLGLLMAAGPGCQPDQGPVPVLDRLRQPTGLAVSSSIPVLLVTNGNWDREEVDSTLVAIDLVALEEALARPGPAGAGLDAGRPCRRVASDDPTIECEPAAFIEPRTTVRLGTGAGNIALDRPAGDEGPLRLLVPTRSPAAVVWMDLLPGPSGVVVECGQDDDQRCGEDHEIRASPVDNGEQLPGEPSRVVVDEQGARFAYVPQLLGQGLSLLALDGDRGPELTDVEGEFFRLSPFEDEEIAGGFSVATRPCDPMQPSLASRECTRPHLYSTHRFFPGLRQFTVAPGLDLILGGREVALEAVNPAVVTGRPFMGDLVFEDPSRDDRLLVVQTTPPGLVRLDTSLGDDKRPVDRVMGAVALCDNPNVVVVHRPTGLEAHALVACAGEGRLAVVGLSSFRVVASVPVGAGAHDVAIDQARQWAYVSNTREDTVSIVELDPRSPARFTEWARLGVGAGSRD